MPRQISGMIFGEKIILTIFSTIFYYNIPGNRINRNKGFSANSGCQIGQFNARTQRGSKLPTIHSEGTIRDASFIVYCIAKFVQ